MELYPFQTRAVRVIKKIWRTNSGAILRGDEGIGKTRIAAAVCGAKKTLMVVPARTAVGIREKMDKYASFCLLYTSPSPRDRQKSRMPSSA